MRGINKLLFIFLYSLSSIFSFIYQFPYHKYSAKMYFRTPVAKYRFNLAKFRMVVRPCRKGNEYRCLHCYWKEGVVKI